MNPILPDDLAVFLQTVQCGSFSAAARALNVAPKVASKQVARLEAALGVALFTRNTRNLRLTDEGEALRDKARSVLDDRTGAVRAQVCCRRRCRFQPPLSAGGIFPVFVGRGLQFVCREF